MQKLGTYSWTVALVAIGALMLGTGTAMAQSELSGQLGVLNLTANGGINPVSGQPWASGDTYRLAFVWSGATTATNADISFYNTIVQDAAAGSSTFTNLGSVTWQAIISTPTVDARDNTATLPGTDGLGMPIFLMNGAEVFANSYADLWDGLANVQLDMTENNVLRPTDTLIYPGHCGTWTGTGGNGTASAAVGNGGSVTFGIARGELTAWLSRGSASPTNELPIYAISPPLTVQGPTVGTEWIMN